MSHIVELKNAHADLVLETVEEIHADAPPVLQLYHTLEEWHGLGIEEVELEQTGAGSYAYKVSHNLGECLETWTFADDADNDPLVTIALVPAWPLSVLGFGAALRRQLIEVRLKVGLLHFRAGMI